MILISRTNAARRRAVLMGTAALTAIAIAAPAQAQDAAIARPGASDQAVVRITDRLNVTKPDESGRVTPETLYDPSGDEAESSTSTALDPDRFAVARDRLPLGELIPHAGAVRIDPIDGQETPQITINNNFTTTEARDPTLITGIGQVVTDNGGGSVGLCTGTLINRRTIIFAAHCVNNRAATAYGANSGGVGIAVAFENNTRANAAGQTDELVRWLFGQGADQAGRFQTNTAQSLYNISQVFWHPGSREGGSCTAPTSCFIEADLATAVLDTPTRNVPTWTMLFSPLAAPGAINPATGTGYHVTISGYGSFGNGTTGAASGSDFRRRIAENLLGGLTSINERNIFLFGTAGTPSRPQLLYWIDFDDPRRGQAGANARDFNGFRDNALTREGSTGPGDSGGPLIIDQAFGPDLRTIIGVLSGGSTFFAGQPGGSYGTQSFYQPLFLYWDWIVANNPYRYVTANAGNRNWEDPTTWVTELDPAYQILLNGQLVNGLPTNLGGGRTATGPQFGELCFQSPSTSPNPATNECEDIATGQPRNNVPNNPSGQQPIGGALTVDLLAVEADDENTAFADAGAGGAGSGLDGAFETPQNHIPGFSDTVNPAPTLANGLPGATNFVANNSDGNRATGVAARYFDVTLRNAGILTLSSTVTIDNFTIAGAQSQLTVAANGSLTSLLEVNHLTGIMNVNGRVTSLGDYFFMSGLLTGTGRVNAPFLTSVMGNFAPGTLGTIGTLTIGGNLVMTSGSTYVLDVGSNGASDLLAVVANGGSTGTANVGGRVLVSPVPGALIRFDNLYTILTAAGGVTGAFTQTDISAILRQQFVYNPNSVQLRITAVPYATVVDPSSGVQGAYATLLDQNRGNTALLGIYDILDLQNAATIQGTLEALAPRTEGLRHSMGIAALDNNGRLFRDRIQNLRPGDLGGRMAYYGRRVETAALNLAGFDGTGATMSDVAIQPVERETRLPETMAGFIAAGFLDGEGTPLAGTLPVFGNDQFDGFYVAGGLEHEMGGNGAVGFALSYTDIEGDAVTGGQSADGQLWLGTLYGKSALDRRGRVVLDGQLSVGMFSLDTLRPGNLPGQTIVLRSSSESLAAAAEVGLGAMFGERIRFGPRVAARVSTIDFDRTIETGGVTALQIDRNDFFSVQGRAGLVVEGVGRIRPFGSATYVHEFDDDASGFGANFVGGTGGNVVFNLASHDEDWFEVAGGLAIDTGAIEISLSADTTLDREDVENQSYRAAIKLRF